MKDAFIYLNKQKKCPYRQNVQQNGPALSFLAGENVIGELVYCWGREQMTKVTTRWQPVGEVTRPLPREEEPYTLFSEEVYTELDWMLY